MTLSLGHSPWLLALCAVVAAALAVWAYRRTVPPLGMGRRALLGGLRFAALLLVLLLLFEPIARHVACEARPPVLAVLVDDSRSLQVTGDSAALPETLRRALRHVQAANPDGAVRLFAFDQHVHALPGASADAAADSLSRAGARTDISAALAHVQSEMTGANLRGVVLVSDGQYTTGRNPLYLAERSPVPIHTVVVGDTTRRRDVLIERVATNQLAYAGAEQPVRVQIRSEGFGGERVRLRLLRDGAPLDAATVELAEGIAIADLRYTPEEAGLHRLTLRLDTLGGEATPRNNVATATVRVLESERQILLLGAAPRPDLASIRQLLEGPDDFAVTVRTPRPDGTYYEGPLPDSLRAFDALVLAGFPGPAAPEADRQAVAEAVAEDVPAFFLLSRQTDLGALRASLEGALPAWPEAARAGFVEAAFVPTPEAARHVAFDFGETAEGDAAGVDPAEAEAWAALPPLAVSQSRWQTSPDARVLAAPQIRGVAFDDPLLVVRRRGGQRTAALLGAGTWRWANLPPGLEASAGRWPRLFDRLIQWLTAAEDDRPVRVEPARTTFAGGEPVAFTGQVYDESLQPVTGASVQLEVVGPEGARYPHVMEAAGGGQYTATVGALPEGTYRYVARPTARGDTLGADRGTFAVGRLQVEYRHTRADAALMRQIAARSGGLALPADSARQLAARLAASGTLRPAVVERTEEARLWHQPLLLIIALLLLAAEWVLRKRSGMA